MSSYGLKTAGSAVASAASTAGNAVAGAVTSTVESIKKDPLKFAAEVAVGIVAVRRRNRPWREPSGKRPSWVDFTSMGGAVIGTVIALLQLLKVGPKGAIVAGVLTAVLGAVVPARARQHHQVVVANLALALALGGAGMAGAGIDRA